MNKYIKYIIESFFDDVEDDINTNIVDDKMDVFYNRYMTECKTVDEFIESLVNYTHITELMNIIINSKIFLCNNSNSRETIRTDIIDSYLDTFMGDHYYNMRRLDQESSNFWITLFSKSLKNYNIRYCLKIPITKNYIQISLAVIDVHKYLGEHIFYTNIKLTDQNNLLSDFKNQLKEYIEQNPKIKKTLNLEN